MLVRPPLSGPVHGHTEGLCQVLSLSGGYADRLCTGHRLECCLGRAPQMCCRLYWLSEDTAACDGKGPDLVDPSILGVEVGPKVEVVRPGRSQGRHGLLQRGRTSCAYTAPGLWLYRPTTL